MDREVRNALKKKKKKKKKNRSNVCIRIRRSEKKWRQHKLANQITATF